MQGASPGLIVDFKHLVAQFLFQTAKLDGGGGALLSAFALNLLHFGQGVDERGVRGADGFDIHNAALGFIEPYASSAGELMTEVLQEVVDQNDILRCEAEALLAGIVLDTKSFTIRTGERTFDAAAYLRRAGADTTDVKKLLQTDMDDTVAKYKILQSAKLYRNLAIAVPEEPQNRVVAASAADELLNISGVDASIVVAPDGNGGSFASARSIGELNVQLIMEKVGGGGNRSAAAAQFAGTDVNTAVKRIYAAIDDYLG